MTYHVLLAENKPANARFLQTFNHELTKLKDKGLIAKYIAEAKAEKPKS